MSLSEYVFSKISNDRGIFPLFNLLPNCILMSIHSPGATVLSMCTKIASNAPPTTVCRGMLTRSSSSVTAGYFAFLMGARSSQMSCSSDLIVTGVSKRTWTIDRTTFAWNPADCLHTC
eukprot:UN10485